MIVRDDNFRLSGFLEVLRELFLTSGTSDRRREEPRDHIYDKQQPDNTHDPWVRFEAVHNRFAAVDEIADPQNQESNTDRSPPRQTEIVGDHYIGTSFGTLFLGTIFGCAAFA